MVAAPIHPVTSEIASACDTIDTAISAFLSARRTIKGYEQFESTAEAINLFNLVVRNIEGVLALAREDLVFLPAALACSRACFETAVKAAWMVNADDAFSREVRWLAHLQEEERVYERAAKHAVKADRDAQAFSARADTLRSFRLAVTSKLPSSAIPLKRNPPMDELLDSLGGNHLYALYIYLSQYVHGCHAATWLFRKGLGTKREAGDYIEPADWYLPLRICWLSLIEPGSLVLWRLGSPSRQFMSEKHIKNAAVLIERIAGDRDTAFG